MVVIQISGLEEVRAEISRAQTAAGEPAAFLKAAGVFMMESAQKNFIEQGRPVPWAPLAPATIKRRRHGEGDGADQILRDTGIMMASVVTQGAPHNIYFLNDASVAIGTNVPQAAAQQFGHTYHFAGGQRVVFFKHFRSGPNAGRTLFSKERKATHGMKAMRGMHSMTIPPRPYLMFQGTDEPDLARMRDEGIQATIDGDEVGQA